MRIALIITHYNPGFTLDQMINLIWFNKTIHLAYRLTKVERTTCNSTGVCPANTSQGRMNNHGSHSHIDDEAHCAEFTCSFQETYNALAV